jgi:hypothetical protein
LALIQNPMGEVTGPLQRVEASLTQLCGELGSLEVLPDMNEGVLRTNERLARLEEQVALARAANEQVAATLESIRSDLGEAVRLLAVSLGRATATQVAEGLRGAPRPAAG